MTNRMLVNGEEIGWYSNEFQWSRRLAPRKTLEVRGFRGSIRALLSHDKSIHVDARRGRSAKVPIDLLEHDNGIVICAGDCYAGTKRESASSGFDVPVDFIVRVPVGVVFEASMNHGQITIEKLRSAVSVATIDGDVRIETAGFGAEANTINGNVRLDLPATTDADFYGSLVSGTLHSDFPLVERAPGLRTAGPFLPMAHRTPSHAPSRPPRIVEATIGQGGVTLRVTVVRGDVQLRRS